MEWLFPVMIIGIVVGLFSYLKKQNIFGSLYGSSHPEPKVLTKAKTEQEIKDDWIAQFKGEPTEGRHKITETYFSKRAMKDGSKWPSYKSNNWPVWKCACGDSGTVVMRDHDYAAAEKRALAEATRHVNDNNYVEWKNKNRLDGRAF